MKYRPGRAYIMSEVAELVDHVGERWIRFPPNGSIYIMFRISAGRSVKLNEIGAALVLLSSSGFWWTGFSGAMATSRSSLLSCLSQHSTMAIEEIDGNLQCGGISDIRD